MAETSIAGHANPVADIEAHSPGTIRVLVAKLGLDGHDRGAKIVARILRDAGMVVARTDAAAIARDGGAHNMVDAMQTRTELYATIALHDFEALDASIVQTIIPEGMPQR